MYTEKSIELKSDFYSRYGEAAGTLYFERTGVPCALLESGSHMLAFSLGVGVRAYGRESGDVLRIIDADSNECDVHFAPQGLGAQILYKQDMTGIVGIRETAEYTIEKLLRRMRHIRGVGINSLAALCDRYGSAGWCAYYENGAIRQVPLPLLHKNVILIRSGRKRRAIDAKALKRFRDGETERITAAAEGLRKCRIDVLFDMLNESERALEKLLSPSKAAIKAVRAALDSDGVLAARICDSGIVCITEEEKTDSIIHAVSGEYEREIGYPAGIVVVK